MRITKDHDQRRHRADQSNFRSSRSSFWRRNGVVWSRTADFEDARGGEEKSHAATSKRAGWATPERLVAAGLFLWAIGAVVFATAVLAQTPTPALDPAQNADALAGWALKLYKAAQQGEWRTFFSALLIGVVGLARWGTKTWKSELETHAWYREIILPLLPVILALLMSVGVDLGADKSVGMSIWRGLNIGLMAGGGYKVWRIVADNAKKLIAKPATS